jgi:4-amino-4-deoxy-L-arabinose transferase-like glycosyltransferase
VATIIEAPPKRRSALIPVPWLPVGGAVLAACGLLAATAGRYGYHRDELYFRILPPAWGYVDQPPLTPLMAKLAVAVFGDTPAGMRVPAVLMIAAAIVLAALTTRELGGGRLAQALSAWGFAFCALPLVTGHLLVTATVDFALWAAVLLCVTRALLNDEPRWWLVAGAVVGVSMYNKLLIAMLLISFAVGLLIVGPRSVLRSRWLWAGVGIALIVGAPNLIYQATHDFPQLTMAAALNDNNADQVRVQILPFQALLIGPPLLPVWIAGLVALLRRPQWRPVRALAVAYFAAVVLTSLGGAQMYYAFGLQAYLLAAGWVPTVDWLARGRWRRPVVYAALAINAVASALIALPLLPITSVGASPALALNQTIGDQVGWPEYVRQIGQVYASLTPEQQSRAVIVTGNYGEAGAIDRFGGLYQLPAVYSGQNELWYLGPPPADHTLVIAWAGPGLFRRLGSCDTRATLDNGYGVQNEEQGTQVAVCELPAGGWAEVWPGLQHYD